MWARRWPGRKPRHSAELVKAVRADSELEAGLARVTAFARHRDSKERQRQVERIPLDSASSQLADDSYVMRLRNTTLDQPVSDRSSMWRDSNEAQAITQCHFSLSVSAILSRSRVAVPTHRATCHGCWLSTNMRMIVSSRKIVVSNQNRRLLKNSVYT